MRQAYVARMMAERAGGDAVNEACKNVLQIYRHGHVSFSAFLHELELTSQQDFGEFARLWFDRPGTFDYGIANTATDSLNHLQHHDIEVLPNDNILMHILSPYPAHRSAVTDCAASGWPNSSTVPSPQAAAAAGTTPRRS